MGEGGFPTRGVLASAGFAYKVGAASNVVVGVHDRLAILLNEDDESAVGAGVGDDVELGGGFAGAGLAGDDEGLTRFDLVQATAHGASGLVEGHGGGGVFLTGGLAFCAVALVRGPQLFGVDL